MSVSSLDRLFKRLQDHLYLLSLDERSSWHPPKTEEKLKIGRIVNDLRGKITDILNSAMKLNRLTHESFENYPPNSTDNLRENLTRSQDSIVMDKDTIIKYICILRALFFRFENLK